MPDINGRPTEGEQWYQMNKNNSQPHGTGKAEPSPVAWFFIVILALGVGAPLAAFVLYLPDAQREVGAVRGLLLRVTEPNWQVWTSLGLLVLGVFLQSLASVLGTVTAR